MTRAKYKREYNESMMNLMGVLPLLEQDDQVGLGYLLTQLALEKVDNSITRQVMLLKLLSLLLLNSHLMIQGGSQGAIITLFN